MHLEAAATLMGWLSPDGWLLQVKPGAGSDAAVLGFLAIVFVLVLLFSVILVATIRVLSDRELPLSPSEDGPGASVGATRFKGGALFAVDGQRLSCSYPFAEIVVDRDAARLRMRVRGAGLRGERIVRRDAVDAIRVSQKLGIPYVEFIDDVGQHGVTRFYAGRTLVQSLADRGWPVLAEP